MSAILSWNTPAPLRLRVGAGAAVVLVHVLVIGAILLIKDKPVAVVQPETVEVRFVEIGQQVQAPPEPVAPTPPAPRPEPKPRPPKPVPKPVPKPPPPQPKPEPTPTSDTALSTPTPPPPAPAPAAPPSTQPPSGTPDSSRAASPQAPMSNEPRKVGQIDYLGTPLKPEYPRMSKRLREEGRVVIRVVVGTDGRVQKATLEQSSGFPRLDESALETVKQERFKPPTDNGVPFVAQALVPYEFSLR